jgi:hypothetical protein
LVGVMNKGLRLGVLRYFPFLRFEFQARLILAGGSPAATYFLLGGQEKVSKEKAALVRRPLTGVPCVTQRIWRLRNSPLPLRGKDSDSPRRHPQIRLRYSASHKGLRPRNEAGLKPYPTVGFRFPLRAAEQHSLAGGSRRALSEPSQFYREGELRSRPAWRAAQGSPKDRRTRGRLLLVTFLGEARKVTRR